jgi:hypothetical protein
MVISPSKDMSVGDDVLITGPTGAEMLLPTDWGPWGFGWVDRSFMII